MSEKLNATIEVGLDGSKVQEGVAPIARTIENLSKVAKKASKETADSVESIGDSGANASGKIDRATNNMIGSIQRTTAAMESGSKSSAKYFEVLAQQRGINLDTLRPYIDQLKAVEQAQKSVGISAGQTAAALRSVPAQFTDIVTSLQGGQKPLTVLLQQGGQLKDMFGGVGNAARAMGGYIVGLINPLTVAAAAVAGLGYVYAQANEQSKAFSKSLILSGNAAGTTTDQLMSSAKRINDLGISSQSMAAEALNGLVSSGNVSMSILDQAAKSAIKSQNLLGIAVEESVKAFSDLGKNPTKSIESLNDKYHFLTLEIYEQIKALENQGKKAEAAQLAQSTYADAIISKSAKVSATLTDWERGWIRIKNAASGAFDATMRVFDDPTSEQKIAKLFKERDKLEESQKRLANDNSFINTGNAERVQKLLDQNKAEINAIRDKIKAKNDEAKAEEAKNKQVQAGIEWSGLVEKNLSKAEKLELEVTKARNLGIAAGKSEKEIEKEIAIIRANGAEKAKKAIEDQSIAWGVTKAAAKAAGKAQEKTYEDLKKSLDSYGEAVKKHTKDIVSGFNEQWQAENRLKSSLDDWARGYQESADLAQLELSLLGQSAVERNTALAQYKIELDLQKQISSIEKERASNKISNAGADEAILKAQQIANDAKGMAGIKAQQEEWTKFYGDIYNGLSDSLYRGFEAGKGFFQNFWGGIKNLFKTTVLKLAVQGVMTGVLGGIAGTAGAASLPSAFSSGANLISVGKSIYDGFSLAASAGSGVAAIGNLLGSSAISAFGAGMGLSSGAASAAAGAYSAAGMGTTASAISAGSVVGTVLPYIAAAAVLYKGLSMGDKTMTGQTITGNLGTDNLSRNVSWTQSGGFLRSDRSGTWSYGLKDSTAIQDGKAYQDTANVANDSAMLKLLNDSYAAIKTSTIDFAKTLGLNADNIASRNDALNIKLGATAEENNKAIQAALTGVADSIAASLLPNFKDLAKEGESASATLARVSANFGGVNKLFSDLGLKLFALGDAGIKASASFVDLFGGLDQLNAVGSSYYENFYTQQERSAASLKAISGEFEKFSLGTLPTTREQYRALVEQISKTGSAEQLAAVLKLSNAFASVVPASEALSAAMEDTSAAAKKAADALAERARLQDEYDSLTMTAGELLAKQRSALDDSNKALFDSIQAVKAKQAADVEAAKVAQDTIAAAQQASEKIAQEALDKANAVANERSTLQDQLNQLTLTETQLLALQREKLDDSNRALFDNIQAVKAKQTADNEATRVAQAAALEIQQAAEKASQAAAARAAEIQNERSGLQDQLNQLTLTNSQLLSLQREKLDESNRALFDQVQAEKARQAAIADSTAAAARAAQDEKAARDQRDQELKAEYTKWIGDIKNAFDRESSVFKDSIDQFMRLGDALNAYNDNLQTRSQSLLSPEAVYNASKSQFDTVASLARKGDQKALEKFQSVADAFLESSIKYNASGEAYFADLEKVKKATSDSAISSYAVADVAKLQLTALEKQVAGIIEVNESIKTVAQLLASGSAGYGSQINGSNGSFVGIESGIAQNILQALGANGGFDSLYSNAQKGDQYAGNFLANQLIRWSDWGLKQAEVDRLIGEGALKKVEELFNVSDQMYSGKLTSWDGANQTPIFSSKVTPQLSDKETIDLLKQQNQLLMDLVNKTQQGNVSNIAALGDVSKKLSNIESNGSLEAAKA